MKTINLTNTLLVVLALLCSSLTCANPSATGRNDYTLVSEGITRQYIVHIPSSYTGQDQMPVVFMFHGSGGSGNYAWNHTLWKELGEAEGFITVFPSALSYCYEENGQQINKTKWLSTRVEDILCSGHRAYDDVQFVRLMITEIASNFKIDRTRIYACGFSNGSSFVNSRLAVEATDLFAALGGVAGFTPEPFKIAQPIPTYQIIGEVDPKIMNAYGVGPIPLTEAGLRATAPIWEVVEIRLNNMQLVDKPNVEEALNFLRLAFAQNAKGKQTAPFVFAVVKGLTHKFPKGNNNPAGLIGANQFYKFFKKFKK